MTMGGDNKCDVCGGPDPIGVFSTLIPYSCAFCNECATRGAEPQLVFFHLFNDVATGDINNLKPAYHEIETFVNGKYITFKEWAKDRPYEPTECPPPTEPLELKDGEIF